MTTKSNRSSESKVVIYLSILVFVLISYGVSLFPYSGYSTPPTFGDFEAQRHWLEITSSLPMKEWYYYDSSYWPLDYPPLTAYHSLLLGIIASWFSPEWVALESSRGIESAKLKLYMRGTAIITHLMILVPALYLISRYLTSNPPDQQTKESPKSPSHQLFLICLLSPALLIIDHGHFQYNAAMLGLACFAFYFFIWQKYALGSVFFCLSLGFKQMALFYSLPVFFYLLGICASQRGWVRKTSQLLRIGIAVIFTFALLLTPIIYSDPVKHTLQILHRIFPVSRGLWEDKVANVWCALNVVIKLRETFSLQTCMRLSILATLGAVLPSSLYTCIKPTQRNFLYALCIGSLSFFLFSFQVHEKSILLPALPVLLLWNQEHALVNIFQNVAMFTMFPLLSREGLHIPYVSLLIIWNILTWSTTWNNSNMAGKAILFSTFAFMVILHAAEVLVSPPEKYPHLYVVLNVLFGAGVYSLSLVYLHVRLFWTGVQRQGKLKAKIN